MSYDFTGRRALVTGGGSGLGRATSLQLAQLGAKVFALSHIQEDLDSLKGENPDIEILCLDLREWSTVREAIKTITPVHLLVNCAGVCPRTTLLDATLEEFDYVFDINVKAILNVTQVVARDLIDRSEKGAIVNVASVAAHRGTPFVSTYCAAKSAVDAYTKCMAVELSPKGIRANAISPTFMVTPMTEKLIASDKELVAESIARTPQRKIAEVEDAVNAISYLLSDESDMVNGHNLPVDGGFLCA